MITRTDYLKQGLVLSDTQPNILNISPRMPLEIPLSALLLGIQCIPTGGSLDGTEICRVQTCPHAAHKLGKINGFTPTL